MGPNDFARDFSADCKVHNPQVSAMASNSEVCMCIATKMASFAACQGGQRQLRLLRFESADGAQAEPQPLALCE